MINKKMLLSLSFLSTALLTGCGSDDNKSDKINFKDVAVIQSVGSGESMLEFTDGKTDVASRFNSKLATDYTIETRGEYFYHIGKFGIDTIQKYHIDEPQQGYYPGDGFSLKTAGNATSANPYNMGFIDDATAVITRYGMTTAWVVNLNAKNADEFLVRELDLSHHVTDSDPDSGDIDPEMDNVFVYNNRVYISMQNLKGWTATPNAKVAVFDAGNWEEIDMDPVTEGIQAIALNLQNHQSGTISGNKIYLGSLVYGATNTGGIEEVNLDDFSVTTLTDEHAVNRVVTTESGQVFFTEYKGWDLDLGSSIDALYKLNADNSTSLIYDGNISALAAQDEVVWIGLPADNNKIALIDATSDFTSEKTLSDITISSVNAVFKPIEIEFLQIEENSELPEGIEAPLDDSEQTAE